MPADLFDPTTRPAPVGGRKRRLTVTTSVIVHLVLVVLIVVVPLIGGVSLPAAMSRIDAFVAPPELPAPPVVQPPPAAASATPMNPNAAPIDVPDKILPEVQVPPAATGLATVPGALPIGSGAGVSGALPNVGPVAITQPPPPEQPKYVRPGGKVAFPKRVYFVEPVYPPIAISARIEATVFLEATIDVNGNVTNMRVLRGHALLDAAAKEAVSKWRYSPTTLNGERVPIIMTVTVTFKLR